jgi:DNA-binding NarL/FixJ family response regulator
VILYSAFAGDAMTVPAIVAGADGMLHKGVPALELYDALRRVSRGETALPAVSERQLDAAGGKLDPEDLPILGMLMDRTPPAEIASTLRIDGPELSRRVRAMLARLSAGLRSGFE